MCKREFLDALRARLAGLPCEEIAERLAFYAEMIDDRIEEGMQEAEAVAAVGSVDEVAKEIIAATPFHKIAKERVRPARRLVAWEIVLLALGAPLWLALGLAALAVVFSVYVALWSVVAAVWSVFASLAACAIAALPAALFFAVGGHLWVGLAVLGAGLALGGLSILAFFGCRAATGGMLRLTRSFGLGLKKCLMKKEKRQ